MRILLVVCLTLFSFGISAQMVKTGIEVLKDRNFDVLQGKRVGLITNSTGVDRDLVSTVDILHTANNVKLVALYAPEHGVRGDVAAGEKVSNVVDAKTGIKVYSLYGSTRKPTQEMLKGIDALVYDIQDIGCRSYTFISTMGLAMQAAAEKKIPIYILDRPNPLGGLKVEGNLAEDVFISFVSQFKIPYIYGLTVGELAYMLNEENMLGTKCDLHIIPMQGWKRSMRFYDTGLPWVLTSPHIPYMQSAEYYPSTGILGELGVMSIGVGYTIPFQTYAHEMFDAEKVANALNALQLAGVTFRPIHYKPYYGYGKDKNLNGVQLFFTDYSLARLSETQFYMMQVVKQLYPDFGIFTTENASRWNMFDKVCGTDYIRKQLIENVYSFDKIKHYWRKDEANFKALSSKYWLYNN
ncbi:MAG: DUF1343 domain-containing protein [Paludibacteraceae bacterium]|nr:DUF1343 domain-containing protein [Paludibacteraceae bacterium]MBP6284243.1 DUF1343 domain-containing protein [Paludibacteraceae bacterium]